MAILGRSADGPRQFNLERGDFLMQSLKLISLLFGFGVLFCCGGCATLVHGRYQELTINSNPPGAKFEVDGVNGTTPGTATVDRSEKNHTVTITKPGYETSQIRIGRELNPWIAADVLLGYGLPIGLVVDFLTGSAYKVGTDNIQVNLVPQQDSVSQNRPRSAYSAAGN
ncbi:MAG: PEGA domain-containing protein [Planctomycetes bacterium]|nr:PEGA domain-containing protein [Planctomycetota bacterium]